MSWQLLVAQRFARARRRSGGVGPVTLAVTAISAGVLTLNVVLAVMNGFQSTTIDTLLEVGSYHLRLKSAHPLDTLLGDPELTAQFDAAARAIGAVPGVRAVSPLVELQTLGRGSWPEPVGVMVRAIEPQWLDRDHGAAALVKVNAGSFDLTETGTVVLGTELARRLGVRVGGRFSLLHISGGGTSPREAQLLVRGTFRTGYLDIDQSVAYVSLSTAVEVLAARDPLELGVKLRNHYGDLAVAPRVAAAAASVGMNAPVVSWREFNRGIFGALRLEKSMMTLLVGLLFIVVGANIAQLQRRRIVERSEEIAVLQAVGAPSSAVHTVFVLESALIGVIGAAIGTALGLLMSFRIDAVFAAAEWVGGVAALSMAALTGGSPAAVRIFSPDFFYLSGVPVRVIWTEVVGIAAAAIGSAVGAGAVSAARATRVAPAVLLRNE